MVPSGARFASDDNWFKSIATDPTSLSTDSPFYNTQSKLLICPFTQCQSHSGL